MEAVITLKRPHREERKVYLRGERVAHSIPPLVQELVPVYGVMLPARERLERNRLKNTQYPASPENPQPYLLKHRRGVHPPAVFVHVAEPAHDLIRHLGPDIMFILKSGCQYFYGGRIMRLLQRYQRVQK